MLHNRALRAKDIVLISAAEHFHRDGYRVGIGDRVQLNSGGPEALVVDILADDRVCIAWRNGPVVQEQELSMRCIRRL